jgi:glycosyltransferase involved in cell wall biosynthesis
MLCRLYWPHGGGVEKHVAELSRVLIERGHRIIIITEQFQPELKLKDNHEGVTIWRIPYSTLTSKRAIWKWIRDHESMFSNADIVHIHDVFWWYWPLRLFGVRRPVFTTFHGYEGSDLPRCQVVVQRKLIELSSKGTICIGDFMKKWYLARPTMISYGAGRAGEIIRLKNKQAAVFVGRLDIDTGIMEYLKAIKLLGNRIFLDIYGDGPLTNQVIQFIKQHNLPAAYHGWTNNPEKKFRSANYAFVSRYLGIIEAMQSKSLVAAQYNNQIKEDYLKCHPQAKEMIIFKHAETLVQEIDQLDESKRQQMTNDAYKWAKQQTWEQLAEIYEKLWQR